MPEGRQIFPTLTVRENLVATAANRLRLPEPWTVEKVFTLFPQRWDGKTVERIAAILCTGAK